MKKILAISAFLLFAGMGCTATPSTQTLSTPHARIATSHVYTWPLAELFPIGDASVDVGKTYTLKDEWLYRGNKKITSVPLHQLFPAAGDQSVFSLWTQYEKDGTAYVYFSANYEGPGVILPTYLAIDKKTDAYRVETNPALPSGGMGVESLVYGKAKTVLFSVQEDAKQQETIWVHDLMAGTQKQVVTLNPDETVLITPEVTGPVLRGAQFSFETFGDMPEPVLVVRPWPKAFQLMWALGE